MFIIIFTGEKLKKFYAAHSMLNRTVGNPTEQIKIMRKNILNVTMALTVLALLTQSASALPVVPEVTSTSMLLGFALGGMMVVRRFLRR
ncbi:MAG: hypothetical protein JWQ04_1734 [Pedosphaera sp.]|nr:hypothetical protein [Pedosphaera sp.]